MDLILKQDCPRMKRALIGGTAGAFAIFCADLPPPSLLRLEPSVKHRACLAPQEKAMSIAPIESVLQQMRVLAPGFERATGASGDVPAGGFAGELKKSLDRISQAQNEASGQAEAFEMGKPGVALNDVMVDLQKASIAFQTSMQVRNKIVAAYQEIMNMSA